MTALFIGIIMVLYNSRYNLQRSRDPTQSPDNMSTAEKQDDSEYYVPYPHPYSFIIDEPVHCLQGAPFLVLMVPVAPSDRTSRDAIRSTWGGVRSARGQKVQLYFLLGSITNDDQTGLNQTVQQQLIEESHLYHDLIQSDFVDSYRNLTLKTMVMFEWLSSHCPEVAYAMKIDSDIFLNVPNLVDLLLDAPQRSYVTGLIKRYSIVQRDKTSKWYLPHSVYPDFHYPPYTLGLGYVFSMDLPKRILEVSAHMKPVYIEDVHVGFCLRELGVAPTSPPHRNLFRAALPFLMTRCYWVAVITTIMSDSEQLLETWKVYQKQLGYC